MGVGVVNASSPIKSAANTLGVLRIKDDEVNGGDGGPPGNNANILAGWHGNNGGLVILYD